MLGRQRRVDEQTLPLRAANLSLVVFGLECEFTRILLEELLEAGARVMLVCLPGPESLKQPIIQRPPSRADFNLFRPSVATVTSLAHSRGLEVWRAGDLTDPATVERFQDLSADLGVVACFNRLIPEAIAGVFRLGAVNVHPSLLPDKRGPDPQFWTLKEGLGQAGVTIHRLTSRFDAGPVLAQRSFTLPDGATERDLDRSTARAGAKLLLNLLPALAGGDAAATPQDERRATYAPFPDRSDFRLDRSRPARTAFNFTRGVEARGVPIVVEVDGADWIIEEAIAYWTDPHDAPDPGGPAEMLIEFNPGVLLARVRVVD